MVPNFFIQTKSVDLHVLLTNLIECATHKSQPIRSIRVLKEERGIFAPGRSLTTPGVNQHPNTLLESFMLLKLSRFHRGALRNVEGHLKLSGLVQISRDEVVLRL